jgi:8-oxo-dGTP diphosphatase
MKKRPNVSVKLILLHKDKVLMIKKGNNDFSFPGGHVEGEESLINALKRELKEEINYDLEKEPVLFDVWNFIPGENYNSSRGVHTVFLNYFLKVSKKPIFSSPEKFESFWLNRKEIVSLDIIKDRKFLDKIFKPFKIINLA